MLSRTAGNLYWLGRYVERADATSRLLGMGARMTLIPGASSRDDWRSVLDAAGVEQPEASVSGRPEALQALLLDPESGSSILSCMQLARFNGRAERTALTSAMWDALNDNWRRFHGMDYRAASRALPDHIDFSQRWAGAFRGAMDTTMLRNDRHGFIRLGSHIERAAMTLRLLKVKYLVLLPERDVIGGGRDLYQWTSLLLASSGLRAYHHLYKGDFAPWNIADLLALNRTFPRSVAFCVHEISKTLTDLAEAYGQSHPCHEASAALDDKLCTATMSDIFADGLFEWVSQSLFDVLSLSDMIRDAYGF
ncbi:MAG: alpha-E domain-containing protein [Pseudomonadota bacterium]